MGADVAAHVETVPDPRQADVEDDDAGVLAPEDGKPLLTVVREQDAVAVAPKVEVHQVGDIRVVLNDDHGPGLCTHRA